MAAEPMMTKMLMMKLVVTVRLLHALRAQGMDVPLDALTVSDCADAVAAALKP